MAIPHLPHLRSLVCTCQDPCFSVFRQKRSSPGILSPHQDHSFSTLYSTVCPMCPLHKSQEIAGKATKLTWGGSLMSVLTARVCTAMYSRLFPCLIISVKSKVEGCCLTTKSQISTHSTGKTALKLQKTVTTSWTYCSWQSNSSSSTSTNCAQGRDVMNNWCGVVESCSEGEQARAQRNCPFILFPSFTPQHDQFSSVFLDKEWSWHISHGGVQTFSTVTQLRSCIWFPQWTAVVASRAADQGSIPRHGCQSGG